MGLMERASTTARVWKSLGVGAPFALVAAAWSVALVPVAIVACGLTACLVQWLAAWLVVQPSSYRIAIDRVLEREANREPSDRVYAAQNRAWEAKGGWLDPFPSRKPPAVLVAATVGAWIAICWVAVCW